MEISTNQCIKVWTVAKLTFQALRNYRKKIKKCRRKEDFYLYCGGENHQARDCPIKASTSKLYKVQNISMSSQS
jgi:hypothetical protein